VLRGFQALLTIKIKCEIFSFV